jgi:four helix bundle protein
MATITNHRQLEAWQLAEAVRIEIDEITNRRSFRLAAELRAELRRSADAACARIADGFVRSDRREFADHVRDAHGSMSAAIGCLESAADRQLIERFEADAINSLARRSRAACRRLIAYLEQT